MFAQYIHVYSTAVPTRTKRLVVDKYMEAARFKEEIKLLQKEMIGFMTFYKNNVLPSLANKQEQLQELLKGTFIVTQSVSQASQSVSQTVSQSISPPASLPFACTIPIY